MHVPTSSTSTVLPRQRLFVRQASVASKRPFPFPPGTNPTPHDIFHLPRSASQGEIKSRYYELVKLYHPDATCSRHDVSISVRNAQFRAITHAYGILRGRSGPNSNGWDYYASRDEAIRVELRRRSRRSKSASASATTSNGVRHADANDSQLRYSLIALVLAGMIAATTSFSSHMDHVERHSQSAAANLAQARTEAQIYGMERRRRIRERVREFHKARDTVKRPGNPETCHRSKVWPDQLSREETNNRASNDKQV